MKTLFVLTFAAVLGLSAAAVAQTAAPAEEDLIQKKCDLCHSAHSIFSADPTKIKELVERMTAKNPEWFKDADKGHLAAALAKLFNDPQIIARRKDWEATVAKGKEVFADATLGKSGKSCAFCHQPATLRRVTEGYPAYDTAAGRYISLQERLQKMIVTKLDGVEIPLGDPRTVALEAYLKSLR